MTTTLDLRSTPAGDSIWSITNSSFSERFSKYFLIESSFEKTDKEKKLLVLSEKGIGKITNISLFPVQGRGGKGVRLATIDEKNGPICFSSFIEPEKTTLLITSRQGQVVKIDIASVPKLSRTAKGVILMRFSKKDDQVANATFV